MASTTPSAAVVPYNHLFVEGKILRSRDEGMRRLIEGNQRFRRGSPRFRGVSKEMLTELAKGQHPYATIVGCSDSRVTPELIFDAKPGELFIVRVAGNIVSEDVAGSVEY